MVELIVPMDNEHAKGWIKDRGCVELVRCKDCKWAKPSVQSYNTGIKIVCDKQNVYHPVNFFCADGKKKKQ